MRAQWTFLGLALSLACRLGASEGDEVQVGESDSESESSTPTSSGTSSPTSEPSTASDDSETGGNPPSTSEASTDSGPGTSDGQTDGQGTDTAETGNPVDDDPLAVLNDEFDDPSTLENWFLRHEVENEAAPYTVLDIDATTPSALTVVPTTSGWYNDYDGFFMFKMLTGNFRVEARVVAGNVGDPDSGPESPFNAAGVMVRNPIHAANQENWVTHNVGFQDLLMATETKSTVNSWSMLQLTASPNIATLRICRLDSQFILARRLDGGDWEQMQSYERADMPAELQVGLLVNGWNSTGGTPDFEATPDIQAMFEYVRFHTVSEPTDCLAD